MKTPSATALRFDFTLLAPKPTRVIRTGVVRDRTGRTRGPEVEKSKLSSSSPGASTGKVHESVKPVAGTGGGFKLTRCVLAIEERPCTRCAVLDVDPESSGEIALAETGQAGRGDLQRTDRPLAKTWAAARVHVSTRECYIALPRVELKNVLGWRWIARGLKSSDRRKRPLPAPPEIGYHLRE